MPFTESGAFERHHTYATHRAKSIDPSPEHFDKEADDFAAGLSELRSLILDHSSEIRRRLVALELGGAPVAQIATSDDGLRGDVSALTARLAAVEARPAGASAPSVDLAPVLSRLDSLERRQAGVAQAALDALHIDIDRKLQGLAQIIDTLARRLDAMDARGLLTQDDLSRFASGLSESLKRDAA